MKTNIIYFLAGVFLLFSCTEEKEFPEVTPFLGFNDQGITELDSKIVISVDLPLEVNSVDAQYFGKTNPVNVEQITEDNQTFKRGTVSIPREDLKILEAAGDAAYVHFVVNGNENDLSSMKVSMSNPISFEIPEKVIRNSQEVKVSYQVKPKYEVSNAAVKVEYIINPNTAGAAYQVFDGDFAFAGDEIVFAGNEFQARDTLVFRVTASANGYQSTAKTAGIVVEPLVFQQKLEATLLNDSSWTSRTEKKLMYQDEFDAIVEKDRVAKVDGNALVYETVDILNHKDSTVSIEVVYKDVNGEDSIVVEEYAGEYAEILYETFRANKEAVDLVQGKVVYAGAPVANLMFLEDGDFMTDANTTLVKTNAKMFNDKVVSDVKALVDAPPATANVVDPSTRFSPQAGTYYAYKVDAGGVISYGVIYLIDSEIFEQANSEGRRYNLEVVYKETL
ncbi:MAG: hypothetical protein ACNS62_01355 [Candidatus Cyclobacteriaceae bacterium M3_2C_046]